MARASSLRNWLFWASAIQNSRMLQRASRCTGSSESLIARSQSAAFSHGQLEPWTNFIRLGLRLRGITPLCPRITQTCIAAKSGRLCPLSKAGISVQGMSALPLIVLQNSAAVLALADFEMMISLGVSWLRVSNSFMSWQPG